MPTDDVDCDGVQSADDCDDSDSTVILTVNDDPECDGFYLHANGVTVVCPDMAVNDTGVVDSRTYTKVDENYLNDISSPYSTAWTSVCTTGVTDMSHMFDSTQQFNQDIGDWDTSSVTDMSYMFYNTLFFNQDIGDWDTGSVTDMSYMFLFAWTFNQDLSDWCVGLIPSEPYDFYDPFGGQWTEPKPVWGTCP